MAKQRLKVSRLFDLNDPFELYAGEQNDKAFRKTMKGWAAHINQQNGVLCFSTSWRDPVMWSHYGDRHKGLCLGLDAPESIVKPIDYRPKRLPFDQWKNLTHTDPPQDVTQRLLTTKFARWRYENERRVIVPLGSLKPETKKGREYFFRPFDDDLRLVEVIAGARCCVKWRPSIESAVEKFSVKPRLMKARLSFRQFKVVTQKLENSVQRGFECDMHWQECPDPKEHDLDC